MKRITISLLAILFTGIIFAQVPEKMTYQAVIRNIDNELVSNQTVGIQITILKESADGVAVYTETQNPTTNENGLVSIDIGGGTTSDIFSDIDWSTGVYFIKTEIDPEGGNNYSITSTSQVLSVPYAFHAKTAENLTSSLKMNNIPVLTLEEIIALNPEKGDEVYNVTDKMYQVFDGEGWNSTPFDCWPQPTLADAGTDQNILEQATSTTLEGNSPDPGHGTGKWSIINGTGGSFSDVNDPNTIFTGEMLGNYKLKWTIQTECDFSEDSVFIAFKIGENITDIDGNEYGTVLIGEQLWMDDNLKVTQYANGTPIPHVTGDDNWAALGDNNTDKAYCWYNDDDANKDVYGALYTYAAAINGVPFDGTNLVQGVCPDGWHLPSDAEWTILENYLADNGYNYDGTIGGGREKIAKSMASQTGWSSSSNEGAVGNDPASNNSSGFSALPGGYLRYASGTFYNAGNLGYWWSSTEYLSTTAYYRSLTYLNASVYRNDYYKSTGFSVRCVRD
ncbi:FISUMP domain-containing protein [Saccharicrinis sp. FJH54]|uniref:FISUMP domain-containing protein n=1 Tax=Saccharicrinis sp. FJH54 TaxID=3344665 RepID=UPI0035D3E778